MENKRKDYLLKVVLVGAIALIAVSLFIFALRSFQTKSVFDSCYENCIKMGNKPVDGSCDNSHYLGVRKTTLGENKKGDPWCYLNAGNCLAFCK